MRNDIAYFEKSISSMVRICEKIDKEFIFELDTTQIFVFVFSKEAILSLVYLLADKANCLANFLATFQLMLKK